MKSNAKFQSQTQEIHQLQDSPESWSEIITGTALVVGCLMMVWAAV